MLPSKRAIKNAAWFGLGVLIVIQVAPILFAVADKVTGGSVGNVWGSIWGGAARAAGVGASTDAGLADADMSGG